MNNVIAGLWYDLREKQLWPVALGLIVAIVVVILLLPEGTKQVAEEPAPAPVEAPEELRQLVKLDSAEIRDSRLDTFSVRDPFRSLADIATSAEAGGTSTVAAPGAATTGGTSTTTTTTTDGGSGGGSTGGGSNPPPPPPPAEQERRFFTFTVDLTYNVEGGRPRRLRDVEELELIPDDNRPFLVFLGVTRSLQTAVFLVNDDFEVETEGRCEPSPATCTFLYLRTDSENDDAVLSRTNDDGSVTRYEFQLDEINRVVARSDAANNTGSSREPAFAGGKDGKKDRPQKQQAASSDEKKDPPIFRPPFFAHGDE